MSSDNFERLNSELLAGARAILQTWFPSGKVTGDEFQIGDIHGTPGESLRVNLKTGLWSDFAGSIKGKDLISLYAEKNGLNQGQALTALGGKITPKSKIKRKIVNSEVYRYSDDFVVKRFDYEDGKKSFSQKLRGYDKLPAGFIRPLFKPEGFKHINVMIVEGEKACIAASRCFGHVYSVITWSGGSKAVNKACWDDVPEDSKIMIWPDCDDEGYEASAKISTIMRERGHDVSMMNVRSENLFPTIKGWDAYDACEHFDYNFKKIKDWAGKTKVSPGDIRPLVAPAIESKSVEIADVDLKSGISQNNIAHMEQMGFNRNSAQKPVANHTNSLKVLENHPTFSGRFRYDTFADVQVVYDDGINEWRPVDDVGDVLGILTYIHNEFKIDRMTKTHVKDAIDLACSKNSFSSLTTWLDGFKWDGKPRIDDFFIDYVFTKMPVEYTRAVGKNMFISAVARAYKPGCKVDNMVILESPEQGKNKTQLIEALLGDKFPSFYASINAKIGSKDFMENLKGKWLVEAEELAGFDTSPEDLKRAISSVSDHFRKSYARVSTNNPRQNVFIGTTNKTDYINDPSGARRLWPIRVETVGIELIKTDYKQLWAEAVHRYKAGESWWEVPKDIHDKIIEVRNRACERDSWEDAVHDWLDKVEGTHHEGYIHLPRILQYILDRPLGQTTRKDSLRASKALKDRGWLNRPVRIDGKIQRRWVRDVTEHEASYTLGTTL